MPNIFQKPQICLYEVIFFKINDCEQNVPENEGEICSVSAADGHDDKENISTVSK